MAFPGAVVTRQAGRFSRPPETQRPLSRIWCLVPLEKTFSNGRLRRLSREEKLAKWIPWDIEHLH